MYDVKLTNQLLKTEPVLGRWECSELHALLSSTVAIRSTTLLQCIVLCFMYHQ
jgi:hypothetical protein